MTNRTALVEDALRRFREAAAEGKPGVFLFRCNAEAVEGEIAALREQLAIRDEQLAVATTRAQRFRDTLMRLAARADDYSGPCVRAHVADALEITVKELEARLEAE